MPIVHKVRNQATGETWCESKTDEKAIRWNHCNCKKCFVAAMNGKMPDGSPTDQMTRITADKYLFFNTNKGTLTNI